MSSAQSPHTERDMKNLIAIIANVAVFGWAGGHFGIWVCLPLAAVYFIGLFQGAE